MGVHDRSVPNRVRVNAGPSLLLFTFITSRRSQPRRWPRRPANRNSHLKHTFCPESLKGDGQGVMPSMSSLRGRNAGVRGSTLLHASSCSMVDEPLAHRIELSGISHDQTLPNVITNLRPPTLNGVGQWFLTRDETGRKFDRIAQSSKSRSFLLSAFSVFYHLRPAFLRVS